MSVNNRIHALPLHLANQISAGEVIERPASVVKELVENSIDAGATLIDIDIESAGNHLIRVRDNGFGIHPDDLALALSRHATSKLHSSEQLSHISSLGFRGEALPSITSISNLTITSRQEETDHAWQIVGDNTEPSPAAHPQGTTIEVRDLFFNVPARRHFLRSNKTESHHILTTLHRLALSQFGVGFHCKLSASSQLKLPIATTTSQQQQRIAKVCGKGFINKSLYIKQEYDEVSLHGWLAKAEAHRPQTDVQYFFINGRVIRDRVINHAIRQAYGEHIPAGRQPAYVLYLDIPLDRVDINVHPTKHEVRFRDARLIHGLITTALQEALSKDNIHAPSELIEHKTEISPIAEASAQYELVDLTSDADDSNKSSPADFGKAIALLHQCYAVTQTTHEPLLLNLQRAEKQLRSQQLRHAIKTNTLRSRPILVPIKLAIDASLILAAEQHSSTLETLGIQLLAQSDGLMIKSIPSLLAQSDIKELITSTLNLIANGSTAIDQLSEVLQQHLPLLSIGNLEQAQQIINQLSEYSIDESWCTSLDQQTLNSLF